MKNENMTMSELSNRSGVSRRTIARIIDDPYCNVSGNVGLSLSTTMGKRFEDVFIAVLNPELERLKFTKENLMLLDHLIESQGIKFTYSTYMDDYKMNISTKYGSKRRVEFFGNFLIDRWGEPSLKLIDFDLIKRGNLIPEKERKIWFMKILTVCVEYAKNVHLNSVMLRLQADNIWLTDPQVSFEKLLKRVNETEKINQYFLMGYATAYQLGFRFDDFTTRHREAHHDFWLKKQIH
ncbi:hypothetical protein J8Y36_13350 [Lactiplantibacillus argentoratensis]|nr:hypothetical protein [Lactiplantibacillus argentoratensis]